LHQVGAWGKQVCPANAGKTNKQLTKQHRRNQMKFNKWTLGLAAVGVVSLTSAVRADETKVSQLDTALSNTTISGYVDVSGQFNPGNGGPDTAGPAYNFNTPYNSISLNVVDIAIDKPLDESPWASGYHVEFWVGPNGEALGVGSDIRQAYIALRTPLGNGIDWKIGIWDTIIGYEGTTSGNNPNYSRPPTPVFRVLTNSVMRSAPLLAWPTHRLLTELTARTLAASPETKDCTCRRSWV
jgi:Putative beta-barrel porin-2, OmpL-like. bbp2